MTVRFYDTTLRDGEQTPGVVFDSQDKLAIARRLADIGVQRIEVGMPAVSKQDAEAVKLIVKDGIDSELWGFCRCREKDIDMCWELGVDNLLIEYPISDYKLKAYGFSPDQVIDTIVSGLQHASKLGAKTAFMPVDGTRTDEGRLLEVMKVAVDNGAGEVVIADTVSACSPERIADLVTLVRGSVRVPVGVHCHNDFGLATACSVAGIRSGADWVHVTVNGLGEKAGNADLAEVAMSLKLLYGVDAGIACDQLTELSQLVADLSGVALSSMKPVVGDAVFARESGAVVAQMVEYPEAVECYPPELVGQRRRIVLGKKSGRHSVKHVIASEGIKVSDEQIDELVAWVKEVGIKRRGEVSVTELISKCTQLRQ